MAYFYAVRGWLQVAQSEADQAIEALNRLRAELATDDQRQLYLKGWCWASEPINWTKYIFYGADVRYAGITLLEELLDKLIKTAGVEIDGYFKINDGEGDGKKVVISIRENRMTIVMNDKAQAGL